MIDVFVYDLKLTFSKFTKNLQNQIFMIKVSLDSSSSFTFSGKTPLFGDTNRDLSSQNTCFRSKMESHSLSATIVAGDYEFPVIQFSHMTSMTYYGIVGNSFKFYLHGFLALRQEDISLLRLQNNNIYIYYGII